MIYLLNKYLNATLEVSGAVRPQYVSLGIEGLMNVKLNGKS
jgi:hypothetical protein